MLATVFAGIVLAAEPGAEPALKVPPSTVVPRAEAEPAAIEREVIAALEKVKPAVVRIAVCRGDREQILGSGVIITPEGHVATVDSDFSSSSTIAVGEQVSLLLAGGRRASATMLGRCALRRLALLRIDDKGPWPHVELGKSVDVEPGELCLALGWASPTGMLGRESRPMLRLGSVRISGAAGWLCTTCRIDLGDLGGGLFDLRGRLIGLNVPYLAFGAHPPPSGAHVAVEQLQRHWQDLAAGKVIDALAPDRPPSQTATRRPPAKSQAERDLHDELAVALAKAAPASVRVSWVEGDRRGRAGGPSGTIVTADGYVVTCEHHHYSPGTPVAIFLPDGREAVGRALRSDPLWDVGLVKITDPGPWPHVELGSSLSAAPGDPCLSLGYPILQKPDATPYREPNARVRMGRIVQTPAHWSPFAADSAVATMLTESDHIGGDSGGGLFDREGRLIGILKGGWTSDNRVTQFPRIELVKQQLTDLAAEGPAASPEPQGPGRLGDALRRTTAGAAPTVVEVLGDGRRRALGTIVSRDGLIVTKASELYGEISCRLADGRNLPAEVRGVSREHDLALLKISAAGLPEVQWSRGTAPPGTLIVALGVGEPAAAGVVGGAAHPVSREAGWLCIGSVKDRAGGLEVVDDSGARGNNLPIRKGDVILHVADHPTPDLKRFVKLTEVSGVGVLAVIAGDPIRVGVRRGDKTLEFCFPLPSESSTEETQSHRRSAFPSVIDVDIPVRPEQCGGPLVDRSGQVVGVTIARRTGRALVYAVPASVARDVASRLKMAAK